MLQEDTVMIAYETMIGTVSISESFLSKLIGHEVTSCFGVVGMIPNGNRQRIAGLISRNQSINTGIKVTGDFNALSVELHIAVVYGMNINAIAASITEKVKYAVMESTGITVNKVIVKVDGIKE